jgi:predicted aconitase
MGNVAVLHSGAPHTNAGSLKKVAQLLQGKEPSVQAQIFRKAQMKAVKKKMDRRRSSLENDPAEALAAMKL